MPFPDELRMLVCTLRRRSFVLLFLRLVDLSDDCVLVRYPGTRIGHVMGDVVIVNKMCEVAGQAGK